MTTFKTFELPNGTTFSSTYPYYKTPVMIGEIEVEFFNQHQPIPGEYQEYVKETFGDCPIHYKIVESKVQYFITAISKEFPQYKPLSFMEHDREWDSAPLLYTVELTFQFEDASAQFYLQRESVNLDLFTMADLCLHDFFETTPQWNIPNQCFEITLFNEVGLTVPLYFSKESDLKKFLVGVRYVEEN